ncbi:hypothetical protein EDB19DRAFT_1916856 [Suillus lakei]|nr:hypothetical protein EDB19DRAFT_1916856 [Suillus lakei]
MPLVTHSGCQTKAPPLPDYVRSYMSKDQMAAKSDVDGNQQTHSHAGLKSVMNTQTQDHAHPLPRSEHSGPMTSSAEEEFFFSNFSRHSLLGRKKPSDVDEGPEVQLSDTANGSTNGADGNEPSAGLKEDGTSNDANEDSVMHHREKTALLSKGECGGAAATNEGERDAGLSDGECGGTTMMNERERDAVPSDSGCDGTAVTNKQEKTAVAPTTIRPRRSGAHKSYAPGHESEPTESSGSDNPARLFRLSANDKQKGPAVADDHGDDADADAKGGDEDQTSEDGDRATHKAGRLSKEGVLKMEEFGKRVMAEATAIGKEFGKHRRVILLEAGLATKTTPNLASWKIKQNAHYHAHLYRDPNHTSLWKKIQHHWDSVVTSPEDLSSWESSSLMTAVHEAFVKWASYWYCTHRIHIAGITIYPGDEECGRQASGFFAGSNMVRALIDAQQVDVKRLIEELTTILKYKDLEAAQAEGKSLSFLPPPVAVPNAPLLCNGKSARDRNHMVAPIIIGEAFADAGHPSRTLNSRWTRMLDILYSMQLCIHDWPAGIPPPGPDFDLKSLSASQLCTLVGPYLRMHLSNTYEAELGRDEDEDDAEKAMMTKQKGKLKKSNKNHRTRSAVVQEPDVILSIKGWTPRQLSDFAGYSCKVYSIPLVINTDGIILHHLEEDFTLYWRFAFSPGSFVLLRTPTIGLHTPTLRLCAHNHGALRLIPPVPIHNDHDELLDHSIHSDESNNDLPPSSPPLSSPHATPQGLNVAAGRYQYNHIREDIRCSMASETRNWTCDDYETAREADDIEMGMVAARYLSRTHDRASMGMRSTLSHNHTYVHAASKASMGPDLNQNTMHLSSRSAVVPYSEGSPSSHQYASYVQPAHVLDRHLLPPVDEDEFEYN